MQGSDHILQLTKMDPAAQLLLVVTLNSLISNHDFQKWKMLMDQLKQMGRNKSYHPYAYSIDAFQQQYTQINKEAPNFFIYVQENDKKVHTSLHVFFVTVHINP